MCAVALLAIPDICSKGGKFLAPVARAESEHEATWRQPVKRDRGLGDMQRVAEREHCGGGADRDARGRRGNCPQHGEGVRMTEGFRIPGAIEGDVPNLDGGETELVGTRRQFDLLAKVDLRGVGRPDRKNESDAHLAVTEQAVTVLHLMGHGSFPS